VRPGAESPSPSTIRKRRADGLTALQRWRQKAREEVNTDDDSKFDARAKERQRHYEQMQLLVILARKAAGDEETTAEVLIELDKEVSQALGNVDEKRLDTARQCQELAEMRKQKQADVEHINELLRKTRKRYLVLHNAWVHGTLAKGRVDKRKITKRLSETGQFHELAILHLKREIEIVKADIKGLKIRAKTQDLNCVLPDDEEPVADGEESVADGEESVADVEGAVSPNDL
jgi:hypothetical protein